MRHGRIVTRAAVRWAAGVALLALAFTAGCDKTTPGKSLPRVPREPFSRTWTERQVFLIGLGDSITAGYGASEGRSYFDLLVKNAPDDSSDMAGVSLSAVIPKLKSTNFSMSASTSEEHLEYQIAKLPVFPDDVLGVVVITTGGNDVLHDYGRHPPRDGAMYGATLEEAKAWVRSFEERLWEILDGVEESFPGGCEIFLANIYDPTDGVGDIENAPVPLPAWPDGLEVLTEMNSVIARAARIRERVHLVDIHGAFLGHGIHHRSRRNSHYRKDDPSYWYFDNLEDPNDLGYDCIRRLFLAEMSEVLAPPASERDAPED